MSAFGVETSDFYRASKLEMATGWVPGRARIPRPGHSEVPEHPRRAMERLLLPALQQRPCVVGFSGGRDSSAVLAVAVDLARREGLDPPIPVTNVYPELDETDETHWQELVIRHLGIDEWVRQEFTDETDLLSPTTVASLRRHGPLWPATIHNREPLISIARGGCYIDGEGGDEVLGDFRLTPLVRILTGELQIGTRAAKDLVKTLGPRRVRRYLARRSMVHNKTLRPWLQPEINEWFMTTSATETADVPLAYGPAILRFLSHRGVQACFNNLDRMGAHLGVQYVHPLLDPGFATALARFGPRWGHAGRTATMRAVFGDLLPEELLARPTKVFFNRAYAHRYTREFVEQWDGTGLDPDLIDAEQLRRTWQDRLFHGGSFQLVHLAWLATHSDPRSGDRSPTETDPMPTTAKAG